MNLLKKIKNLKILITKNINENNLKDTIKIVNTIIYLENIRIRLVKIII